MDKNSAEGGRGGQMIMTNFFDENVHAGGAVVRALAFHF